MVKNTGILIVDDDQEICELLSTFLTQHHFQVVTCHDGDQLMQKLLSFTPDLIILDIMLPGRDGFSLCQELRKHRHTPIIMLTAMNNEVDRVTGLEIGADDYLAKPFSPRELLARIKAVLRRSSLTANTTNNINPPTLATNVDSNTALANHNLIQFNGWILEPHKRRLTAPDGIVVELSTGEFDLLIAFITHAGRVLTREQLLDLTRERALVPFDRSIDVQVGRLRRKIEIDSKNPTIIKTIRGGGYQFTAAVTTNNSS